MFDIDAVQTLITATLHCDAVLIAGPTASGKSAAAALLAERVSGVVINADSMQVYREAPILTAQPSAAARAKVPHLLYGHVGAREGYSVGRYLEDARGALAAARAMERLPIFVGGTGLYFTALTEGLAEIPLVPPEVRAAARALITEIGPQELHVRLRRRDPETAARLRPGDRLRVARAWEVLEATGRPLVQWQKRGGAPILKGPAIVRLAIDPPRAVLGVRIRDRFETMLNEGALEEARALQDLDSSLPAAKLLGLRPLIALAKGRLSRMDAVTQATTATRQFAKRQSTWFRNRMADYIFVNNIEEILLRNYGNSSNEIA
ncbi:MAG: tRNA (adenosine(37)-N6)-dimethylallyltransferase MiaA [Rhizomicrobium sp.]